jgi:transposase-like protein
MSREQRRQFTADEKATILRRHLADKFPVSDLCDEYTIQPSLFYLRQRQALENLGAALEDRRTRRSEVRQSTTQQRTIEKLQAQIQQKDAVIANTQRLHSPSGHVSPTIKLEGRDEEVWTARELKLKADRARRRQHHQRVA